MGSDPAPFWANLFLFFFENEWLKRVKQTNNILARKFGNTFRFIDDLIAMNDGGQFEKYYKEIYPPELQLKKENAINSECSFLDIDITIKGQVFETKLFDKRESFNFSIVRLPFKYSNIPSKMVFLFLGS